MRKKCKEVEESRQSRNLRNPQRHTFPQIDNYNILSIRETSNLCQEVNEVSITNQKGTFFLIFYFHALMSLTVEAAKNADTASNVRIH